MNKRQKIRNGIILLSFFLFPATFYYLSPVLVVRASAAGIVNGSLLMFLAMFAGSLFFGRAFCGWMCPGAGCQEVIFLARDKKVKGGDFLKWLIWVPWISSIAILAVRSGGFKSVDFFYQTTYGFSIGNLQGLLTYFGVLLLLIVLPAFVVGKRSFCHHLCWMSPFMILGRKIRNRFSWPSLRLTADPRSCVQCRACAENCPMSLPVEEMVRNNFMENPECVLCGTCIDGCKQGAIRFTLR